VIVRDRERRTAVESAVLLALVPPSVLLAFGSALVWAFGRIIRNNEGSATVPMPGKCFSSCALIYIAGGSRTNVGQIGLHRPYFSSAPLTCQEIEPQAPLMLEKIKEYVQSMGVTDWGAGNQITARQNWRQAYHVRLCVKTERRRQTFYIHVMHAGGELRADSN
jgi:hypothetical protein